MIYGFLLLEINDFIKQIAIKIVIEKSLRTVLPRKNSTLEKTISWGVFKIGITLSTLSFIRLQPISSHLHYNSTLCKAQMLRYVNFF